MFSRAADRADPASGKGASGKGASGKAASGGSTDRQLAADANALARDLGGLMLDARQVAQAVLPGLHGQRRAGPGEAFLEYREPLPGESLRMIDWRRSGRTDRLFVREREREVPARLHLWTDARATMDWSSQPSLPGKARRAATLVLALGLAARRQGEAVLVSGASRPAVSDMALAATLAAHGLAGPLPPGPGSALMASDGLEDAEVWRARARAASAARCRLVVLLVADPAEETFPYRGRVQFLSPGTDPHGRLLGRAEAAADAYRALHAGQMAAVEAALREAGADVVRYRTDQPLLPAAQRVALLLSDGGGLRR